jgi:hypothetical protein
MFKPREAMPPEAGSNAADGVLLSVVLPSTDGGGGVAGVAVLVASTTVKGI